MMDRQFVILRHEGIERPHFDLMFELEPGGMLMTLRSSSWPITEATRVEKLADHRRDYLDYEGEISGGRGFVKCVDRGTYRCSPQWDDPYVIDLWLEGGTKQHLWLLQPPGHEWMIQPAR
jgi:hypothetical protein